MKDVDLSLDRNNEKNNRKNLKNLSIFIQFVNAKRVEKCSAIIMRDFIIFFNNDNDNDKVYAAIVELSKPIRAIEVASHREVGIQIHLRPMVGMVLKTLNVDLH